MNVPDSISVIDFVVILITFFLGYQIYRVLGTRTGTEKKRSSLSPREPAYEEAEIEPVQQPSRTLKKIKDPKLLSSLESIMAADASFNPDTFLDGAKKAFDLIFHAFIEGNKQKLKPLLSTALYNDFCQIIDEREKQKHVTELEFFRLVKAEILAAALVRKTAKITVALSSEQTVLIKDSKGALVEGDANHIDDVRDVWVFERKVSSTTPIWVLKEIIEAEEEA